MLGYNLLEIYVKRVADPGVDTSTWLTSVESGALIGVSHCTVRTWSHAGKITTGRGRRAQPSGAVREVDVFDPQELAVFCARRRITRVPSGPGEIAATAFQLFDQGASLRSVVVDVRETPQRVAELHEQWLEFGGCDLVIGREAREALVGLVGEFSDVADLVRAVGEATRRRVEVSVDPGSALDGASDAQVEQAILAVVGDDLGLGIDAPADLPGSSTRGD